MPVTAQFLRNIMAEARPIIERQMNDAKIIAGLRTVVANNGGDWGALKALIKAHVEDEADDTGDGKRVKKIVDKADDTAAYADMLGLANMNENNFSEPSQSYAEVKGADPKLIETVAKGVQTEIGRKALITALDAMIDAEAIEITEHEQPETADEVPAQDSGGTATGESPSGKSNAAHPVSEQELADADLNDGAVAGQTAIEVVTAGETAPHSNPPAPSSQDTADKTGEVVSPPASPVAIPDDDVPAFIKKDKDGCLKLKDGHCRIGFETPALCSDCNNARMKARADA